MLRRETAVELPITPSKQANAAKAAAEGGSVTNVNELYDKSINQNDRSSPSSFNRNLSAENSYVRQSHNYLIPSMSEPTQPHCFKKSIESLQKNSSSDTDYSLQQPYKVIKQSSNETNTSLTGSFNVDQSSFSAQDTSLETNDTSALNVTVIENVAISEMHDTSPPTPANKSNTNETKTIEKITPRQISIDGGMRSLKKQFSIDHSAKAFNILGTPPSNTEHTDDVSNATGNGAIHKKCLKPPTISTIPATPTKLLASSSSASADESKDERNIPTISTNLVQDEIAKLSSNIKNSSADDENGKEPPFNETMC